MHEDFRRNTSNQGSAGVGDHLAAAIAQRHIAIVAVDVHAIESKKKIQFEDNNVLNKNDVELGAFNRSNLSTVNCQ